MKKTKIWVLSGIALLLLGALLWVIGMSSLKWDFYALDAAKYTEKVFVQPEGQAVSAVELHVDSFGVTVKRGDSLSLTYYETDDSEVKVAVENGTLKVHEERKFHMFHIGIFRLKRIKYRYVLTVPDGISLSITGRNSHTELYDVTGRTIAVHTTNTDFWARNCSFDSLTLDGTNIDVELYDCEIERVQVHSVNLDFEAKRLRTERLEAKGTNSDAEICDSYVPNIRLTSTNGDYTLSRVEVHALTIESVNLDADLVLSGERAEYTVETSGSGMPKGQTGSTDKRIYLSGRNNDVTLRFV